MYVSGESLLIILLVGRVGGWPGGKIKKGSGFGVISRGRGVAATRHSLWLGGYIGDHRRHPRCFVAIADHEVGSRRKWMASKNGQALEQNLVSNDGRFVWVIGATLI